MTVEFDKITTKLFRVSDLAQRAIKILSKEISLLEEDFLKNSNMATNEKSEMKMRPQSSHIGRLSTSEQHYIRLSNKVIIKNSLHCSDDRPNFIANYVFDKPIPQHLQQRVLSADKRQEILTGIPSKSRPVSKTQMLEAKVKEINIEQNRRNQLMDRRSQKARIEEIKRARLHLQAVYDDGRPDHSLQDSQNIKIVDSIQNYQSDKTIPLNSEDFPQPIEHVEKQYKKMKSLMATSTLVGMTGKSSRMIQTTNPESE